MIREIFNLIGGPSDGLKVGYSGDMEPPEEWADFPVFVRGVWQSAVYARSVPSDVTDYGVNNRREFFNATRQPFRVNYRFTGRYIEQAAEEVSHP